MKMKIGRQIVMIVLISGLMYQSNGQPALIWGKQFGTDRGDSGQDIVPYPSGEFVLAGTTSGSLCSKNLGQHDGFLIKFDSLGNEIWKTQFGTNERDRVWELEKDAMGNLYAAGMTVGAIDGEKFGDQDMFVFKYDKDGNLKEKLILGTDSTDYLSEIYIDGFYNLYIAGNTKGKLGNNRYGDWDYFIMKLDSSFSEIFTLQFGTDRWDYCHDFKIDINADIYVGGFTFGNPGRDNLGNSDAFIAKYSPQGDLLMMRQFGTEQAENVSNILIDADNNLYVSGSSHGNIAAENKGKSDVFMMKIDNRGDVVWKRQFGTPSWDEAWYMSFTDSDDRFILSGSNNPNAYVRKYDLQGNLVWSQVLAAKGKKAGTGGRHFALYEDKHLYFTGFTFANLFSQNTNQDEGDVFVVKLGLNNE